MRKLFTIAIISTIYFAWVGVCLADDGGMLRRTWTLTERTEPIIGPLGDNIAGPEYYPQVQETSLFFIANLYVVTPTGFVDSIVGTGSNGDLHRITPQIDYYAEDGRVTIKGYNASSGLYDPDAEWKNVWISSDAPVFTGEIPNFPIDTTKTSDTDLLVGFVLPNPRTAPDGIWDLGRIAQSGLSEADFLTWKITGEAKSSYDDRGASNPSFVGSSLQYHAAPVPEPMFAGMAVPVVLFGFLRLWLLGRRMR